MLSQKSFLSFVLNLVSGMLGYVSLFFVSRYMGPEPLGLVAAALSFVNLFAIVGDLGFGLTHVKKISEGLDFGRCNGTFLFLRAVTTALMAIATLFAFFIAQNAGVRPYMPHEYESVFFVVLAGALIGNLFNFIATTFTARTEVAKGSIALLTQRAALTATSVVVAVSGLGVVALAGSNFIAAIAMAALLMWFFRSYPLKRPDRATIKLYVSYGMSMTVLALVDIVYQNVDKILINAFSNPTEVGYYAAAQSVTSMIAFAAPIIINLLLPVYSEHHANGRNREIGALASKVERYASMLFMPFIAAILFFPSLICSVFLGAKFAPASTVIAYLSLNTIILLISRPYTVQLIATNNTRVAVILGALTVLLNVTLNVVLIPTSIAGVALFGMGANGAAIAAFVTALISSSFYRYFAFRQSKTAMNKRIVLHVVSAGAAYFIVSLFAVPVVRLKVLMLMLYFGAGIPLYLLFLFLMREFRRDEARYFMQFFSLKKLLEYVRGELTS